MNKRVTWLLVCAIVVALLAGYTPISSASPPQDSSIIHIVRAGETLYSIARYYGVDMWALARANNIINPNQIYVGQRLTIYRACTTGFIHVVQAGETLYRIAIRYGISAWSIAQANGIYNMNHIWVGQRLLIPSGYSPPAPAPVTGNWYGEYFNNDSVEGTPATTRYDASINFNWGRSAPFTGMDADEFSVRWTRSFTYLGGTYRFYARVDDGVRVWIDDELIIDEWEDGSVRTFGADKYLAPGTHNLRVEYYDRIDVAKVYFWWEKLSGPSTTPTPTTTSTSSSTSTATAAPTGGWYGQFYANRDLSGDPYATRVDPWIGFEWGYNSAIGGMQADHFSVRWTNTIHLNTDTYRFCAMSDDGVRIWVDGNLVLDEWHASNSVAYCGAYWVETGDYEVKVEYFEDTGNALIYFWWEPH